MITKPTKPKFRPGDSVRVTNSGATFSTYEEMAEFLGLKQWQGFAGRYLEVSNVFTVVDSALHGSIFYEDRQVVAIRNSEGREWLVGSDGLELVEASPVDPVVHLQGLLNELVDLRVKVEQYRSERDAAILRLEGVAKALEA